MQNLQRKLRHPKYQFWLAFSLAGGFLLFEIVPKLAATSPVSTTAPALPREVAIRKAVVEEAKKFLDTPYKFGGTTPAGFDCGGLILYLYQKQGFTIPHAVFSMRPTLRLTKHPKKGDVLFFLNDNRNVGHVGLYVGENKFIHAPKEGAFIRYERMNHPYWRKRLVETRSVF